MMKSTRCGRFSRAHSRCRVALRTAPEQGGGHIYCGRLSAIGLTPVEIADKLRMSARTVNQHVDNVADKLGTRNRTRTIAELVRNDMLN
jgi:DNA-binding CsgD family transcriptional regulator